MAVVIETTIGDVTVDLFVEERPRACLNFIKLCKLKYYNFNLFHTIERDFIAQTGDPTGVGDGGESIWGVVEGPHKRFFEAESLPKIKHTVPGLLSLVSVGKFMVGSQFFFTLGSDLTSLDGIHCVIGEVVEGHEVLRQLNEAIVDENFRPFQDIRVTHTVILDDPFSDPRGFQVPSRSPSPSAQRLQNGRIGADEDIDDTEGKTMEEIQEMLAEREAKARATILEIVGDLPDADIAPPENVLFVCKLNPVTTDDDLEIIFSRFGKVKSCEVIKDKVTGDSLQYAFVEFEEQKSCEAAYFKMDNVLIDDRRIHVDFSQSVSKVQWRGKGRGVVHADERDKKMDFDNLRGKRGGYRDEGRRRRSRSPDKRNERQSDSRRDRDVNRRRYSPNRGPRGRAGDDEGGNGRRPRDSDSRSNVFRRPSPKDDRRTFDDRHRTNTYDRRTYSSNRTRSPDERKRSPHQRYRSPDRQSRNQNTKMSQDSGYDRRNQDSQGYRNTHQEILNDRNSTSSRSRADRGDQSRSRDEVVKPRKETSTSEDRNRKQQPSKELVKSKKGSKNKKRKKEVTSSSSSSESDSDSSSSTASSSSSEEERRKKTKKSKKKGQKTKKRPKKKSKRRSSSSSD